MRVRGYPEGTLCWAEITSPDLEATNAFYTGLFGWVATPAGADELGGYTLFQLDDRAVAGARPAGPDRRASWLPYIASENLDSTAALVVEAGGRMLRDPVDVGDIGREAVLADPTGAAIGLWQRGRIFGAQLVNEPDTVCWADLATRDPQVATEFYAKAFGWQERAGEAAPGYEYHEWHDHGRAVGGMIVMGERFPPQAGSYWGVTMMVTSCAASATHAVELGGRVQVPPTDIGVGTYAQLSDPHGAGFRVIELVPEILATL